MTDLIARFLNKNEHEYWDALLIASSTASIFNETKWLETVAEVMGCDIRVLGVFRNEELLGGVPLNISKRFALPVAVGIPLTPVNSCIIKPSETPFPSKATNHLLEVTDVIGGFLQRNYDYAVITNYPFIIDIRAFNWLGWRTQVFYTYHINLQHTDFSLLPKKRRYLIRDAKKSGIKIERFHDFSIAYKLLTKTFLKKGAIIPLTMEQLSRICLLWGNNIVYFIARAPDGEAIASYIWLTDNHRKMVHALFAGFDYEYHDTNAPSLIVWQAIEYFKETGYQVMDMVGAENRTISRFKAEFDGTLVPYYQVSATSLRYRLLNLLSQLKPFGLQLKTLV